MKKAELETKILELEKKIAVLEARPQTFCPGHTCTCNHWNYPQYPTYPGTGPIWVTTYPNTICDSGTVGQHGTQTFGMIS